jgi:hypothetical protein
MSVIGESYGSFDARERMLRIRLLHEDCVEIG